MSPSARASARRELMLKLLREGEYSGPDLIERLGMPPRAVYGLIRTLREEGHAVDAIQVEGRYCYVLRDVAPSGDV